MLEPDALAVELTVVLLRVNVLLPCLSQVSATEEAAAVPVAKKQPPLRFEPLATKFPVEAPAEVAAAEAVVDARVSMGMSMGATTSRVQALKQRMAASASSVSAQVRK